MLVFPQKAGQVSADKVRLLRQQNELRQSYSPKEANKVLFEIINSIKETGIFPSFPGKELIIKQKLIENQIEEIAKELEMELTITTKYLGLLESGFYFSKSEWKNFEMGFNLKGMGFKIFLMEC